MCQSRNLIKKEAPAQVFSCEFCEISKKTFLRRTLLVEESLVFSHYLSVVKFYTKLLRKILKDLSEFLKCILFNLRWIEGRTKFSINFT